MPMRSPLYQSDENIYLMKLKRITSALVATLMVLSACYKEDLNRVYSRQYVLAGEIKEMEGKIVTINRAISNLGDLINVIENKQPVSNLVYKVVEKDGVRDTLGAQFSFGETTVYIPFGRKGEPGDTPQVTIGSNGNWFINNVDTEKPSRGENGQTPVMGIKQDTINTDDPNYYWTVRFGNEVPQYILSGGKKVQANGEKGDPGEPGTPGAKGDPGEAGTPGTSSPIVNIEKTPDGTKIIITTTIKGLERVEIPLAEDLEFVIKPQEPTANADKYDVADNLLKFTAFEEEIEVPYEHSDPLTEVFVEVPEGWTVRVDAATKKAYIKAPTLKVATLVEHHNLKAVFHASTPKGKSWVRYVNVDMEERFVLNYFYNAPDRVPTDMGSSPRNAFTLSDQSGETFMLTIFGFRNMADAKFSEEKVYANTTNKERILKNIKSFPGIVAAKPTKRYDGFSYMTVLYQPDIFDLTIVGNTANIDDNDPHRLSLILREDVMYIRHINAAGDPDEGNKFRQYLVKPLPKDVYLASGVDRTGYEQRTKIVDNRLRRLTQEIEIGAANPAKMFGLPEGVKFDIKQVRFYFPTHLAVKLDPTEEKYFLTYPKPDFTSKTPQKVFCRAMAGDPYTEFTYDEQKDVMVARFYTFPNTHNYLSKIIAEYRYKEGNTTRYVKKIMTIDPEAVTGPLTDMRLIGDSYLGISYGTLNPGTNTTAPLGFIFRGKNTLTVGNRRTSDFSTGHLWVNEDGTLPDVNTNPKHLNEYENIYIF